MPDGYQYVGEKLIDSHIAYILQIENSKGTCATTCNCKPMEEASNPHVKQDCVGAYRTDDQNILMLDYVCCENN